MKILIISAYFPPYNAIGAVRVGKLAEFFEDSGHEVKIVAAKDYSLDLSLDTSISETKINSLNWFDVNFYLKKLIQSRLFKLRGSPNNTERSNEKLSAIYKLYKSLFHWPDRHMFWYFPAVRKAKKLHAEWNPDIIYASAMPVTSLMVAANLSHSTGTPWVAEFRDLWLDNHYYDLYGWRKKIDSILEKKMLKTASLLVTVSEGLASILEKKFAKKTIAVLSGFDKRVTSSNFEVSNKEKLSIVHTGMIYPNKRDPSVLFEAINALDEIKKNQIEVKFFGRIVGDLEDKVRKYALDNTVKIMGSLPHQETLLEQEKADVLLLLLWNVELEKNVLTGKIFEYLSARRPILSIGLEHGEAPNLINRSNVGISTNRPEVVQNKLKKWLKEKEDFGYIRSPLEKDSRQFTRKQQFKKLLPELKMINESSKGKKKLFFIINALEVGGTEKHLLLLMPFLVKKFEVSLFVFKSGGSLENDFSALGISIISPLFSRYVFLRQLFSFLNLFSLQLKYKNAVFHYFLPEAYIIGGTASLLAKHPNSLMSRRSLNEYQKEYAFAAPLEKRLHPHMRWVLANSKAVETQLIGEGVNKCKLKLIANGVLPQKSQQFSNKLYNTIGIPEESINGRVIILCAANYIGYKGHSDLLYAMVDVVKNSQDQPLLLCVGRDDGVKAKLESIVNNLGLENHVVLAQQIKNINEVWSLADIGVLSSHQEGFSNSILEGMASKLPMVVTDVGGSSEAVVDGLTGFVVPKKSPSLLSIALLKLINDPELRKKMGLNGHKRFSEKYSIDKCAEKYVDLYAQIFNAEKTDA